MKSLGYGIERKPSVKAGPGYPQQNSLWLCRVHEYRYISVLVPLGRVFQNPVIFMHTQIT